MVATRRPTTRRHSVEAGECTVTLTVRDDRAVNASSTGTATARLPNGPPTASFIWLCKDLTSEFRDRSRDDDGSITQRHWSSAGTESFEQNPTHTFPTGDYQQVTLTITDDRDGMIGMGWVIFLPAPQFTVSCESLTCAFTLEGGGSGALGDFGDGSEGSGASPTHTYRADGAATFTVRVSVGGLPEEVYYNWGDVAVTP